MKYSKFAVLLIPLIFTVLAVTGYGFIYRAAVSVSCVIIIWFMSERATNNSILWIVALQRKEMDGRYEKSIFFKERTNFTKGKKKARIRIEHVQSTKNELNSYYYWVFCYR